jgi:hypothetical protein
MKNILKAIRRFFLSIWNYFFGKKEKKTLTQKEEKGDNVGQIKWTPKQVIPVHNNRKNGRGRYTQHIVEADGTSRTIYHGAKK